MKTNKILDMTYTFSKLEQDAKWKAIYTYCKHMNCFGGEKEVDLFLSNCTNIFFNKDGYIQLHKIGN